MTYKRLRWLIYPALVLIAVASVLPLSVLTSKVNAGGAGTPEHRHLPRAGRFSEYGAQQVAAVRADVMLARGFAAAGRRNDAGHLLYHLGRACGIVSAPELRRSR